MKRSIVILMSVMVAVASVLYSCKTDTPAPNLEYISRIKVIATNQADFTIDTFDYINFSEAQNTPPSQVDTIRLSANATYSIQLKLINEANNPMIDLTDSISALGDEHLMVYNVDPTSGLIKVKILDKDSKGLPIGLMSTWQTSDSTSGYLRLILYHQPVGKNGTPTPGNVDYEADFPIVVR